MNLRVSVSDIECYRYYKDNEDQTLERCLAQLRRQTPPSPAMEAGRALHAFLENATYSEPERVWDVFDVDDSAITWAERDGFRFYFGCEIDLEVPTVRELKGEITIHTPSATVTLVGVVDAMDTAIHDYKLTGRFEAERFADSYQWRCYLLMFGAERFVYNVFVGQEDANGTDWTIKEYHELEMYRYPGMEEDVRRELSEFVEFILAYMPEKRKAA